MICVLVPSSSIAAARAFPSRPTHGTGRLRAGTGAQVLAAARRRHPREEWSVRGMGEGEMWRLDRRDRDALMDAAAAAAAAASDDQGLVFIDAPHSLQFKL